MVLLHYHTPTDSMANCYPLNTHHFPCVAKHHGLVAPWLLYGDVLLNLGPISFGAVNCRSVKNKGLRINDTVSVHSVDILAVTETLIRENTDSLLHSIHEPHIYGWGGGVGFFVNKTIKFRSLTVS